MKEKIEGVVSAKTVRLVARINELDLQGREFVGAFGLDIVEREYNGIGPAFFPAELRAKVTEFLGIFEPAAVGHDLRNYMSDGSEGAFHVANREFLANCRKCAAAEYQWEWKRPLRILKRWRAYAVAELMYKFVDGPAGWRAWMDCYEKNQKRMETK